MYKKILKCIIFTLLMINLVSCSNSNHLEKREKLKQWFTPNGKIKVLSTTSMIHDIVIQVGKEHVDGIVLIPLELDPHSYQLVKGDDEKLTFAQLIFCNGLGLEHGPSLRKTLTDNTKVISVGDQIQKRYPDRILKYHGQIDPHIWMDISLWEQIITSVVRGLSQQRPELQDFFQENGEQLSNIMKQEHNRIAEMMQEIDESQRYLVTSHDAFNYFTRAYLSTLNERENNTWQKRFAAPEGLAPDSQLSATDIQFILDHLAKYQIEVIFPECNLSQDSINKIVHAGKEKGLNIQVAEICLYSDSMGAPGTEADTYLKMVKHNAEQIAMHLKKNDKETKK